MARIEKIVGYDGSKFRNGQETVRKARLAIDTLPVSEETRQKILKIAQDISIGTITSSEAIHHPFHREQEIYNATKDGSAVGSRGDYYTDANALEEFPARFNTEHHSPKSSSRIISFPRMQDDIQDQ